MSDIPIVLRPVPRAVINRAKARSGAARQDRADLDQELTLRLLQGLRHYRPNRGPVEPFAQAVVERSAAMIARERAAKKRAAVTVPLSALAWDPAGRAFDADAVLRAIDVAEALRRLPRRERALARRLMTQTVSEAARSLRVPRSSLQRRVADLRRRLEALGFGNDSAQTVRHRGPRPHT